MSTGDDTPRDLRDESTVLDWLAAGVISLRETPPTPERLAQWLDVLAAVVASGSEVLPFGVLADIVSIVVGDVSPAVARRRTLESHPVPATLVRRYEDHVLGRLHVDPAFQRGAAAVCRYHKGDRVRALAYLVHQLQRQIGLEGVLLSPGVLRGIAARNHVVLCEELATRPLPALQSQWLGLQLTTLCRAFRHSPELLAPEDLFELERGTAVKSFGQRLALRQTLQAARHLAAVLPSQPPRVRSRWRDVPTPIAEEDQYPVGGYTSLSTRGSIESLLHSQLAYMERDERPDLFDIKFLRDELLYFSRDDNQFLRPRRTTFLVLHSSLVAARVKDSAVPFQRIILTLGLITAAVQTWMAWLTTEALHFEIVFLDDGPRPSLPQERELLETVFSTERDVDVVRVRRLTSGELESLCEQITFRSRCHAVQFSSEPAELPLAGVPLDSVLVSGPIPELSAQDAALTSTTNVTELTSDPLQGWHACLRELVVRSL